jgi:hypothetical protein
MTTRRELPMIAEWGDAIVRYIAHARDDGLA